MKIEFRKQPTAYLSKCPEKVYYKIIYMLVELSCGTLNKNKIAKLQGRTNEYRIELQPYRVTFAVDKEVITITKIDTRGGVYKGRTYLRPFF